VLRLDYGRKKIALDPIDVITRSWLNAKEITYDNFTLEKGNEDVEDPESHFRNVSISAGGERSGSLSRMMLTKQLSLLSSVISCSYSINLIIRGNHSPNNVVRADSWDEIYKSIKKLI